MTLKFCQHIITLYDISSCDISFGDRKDVFMVNFKGGTLTETTLYILTALNTPLHGYGIIKLVEEMTKGRITLGPGTLYGALQTLEKAGAIAIQGSPEGGRKRKTYLITPLGKGMLENELRRLEELVINIKDAIKEA